MVDISRLRVEWSGSAIDGAGISTFYTTGDPVALRAAAITMFTSIASKFPSSGVAWVFPGGGEVLDATTGTLRGVWTGPAAVSVTGAGTGSFAKGVGARMVWETGVIAKGRRVRGSTYLVPLLTSSYDTDGSLTSASMTTFSAAASAFVTATGPSLTVWSRPSAAGVGGTASVSSGAPVDRVSWLTSRRS